MSLGKIFLLAAFCLLSGVSYAQKARIHNGGKSMYTRERYNSAAKVRGAKAKTICPIFESSKYPYQGFGIKLGDPFAITYKYYFNKRFAVAADVGKASSGLYNRYFKEKFAEYIVTDTFSTTEASIEYYTHKVVSDIIAEAKILYHFDVTKISPGLQFYLGLGWEWKNTKLQYDYTYKESFSDPDKFGRFNRTRFTMGPQAVAGIEYAHFKIPISAFMELEYFSDVSADPGWSRVEGGVGLRYIF
ncbi:MAG: hypothetical protein WKF87_01750 [Chryseolinea sp.]